MHSEIEPIVRQVKTPAAQRILAFATVGTTQTTTSKVLPEDTWQGHRPQTPGLVDCLND